MDSDNNEIVKISDVEVKIKEDKKKKAGKKDKTKEEGGGDVDDAGANNLQAPSFFSWPTRRETEQTVYHDVYKDSELTGKKTAAEMSKKLKEFTKIKWRIIIPFIILTIAVSIAILISLYAAISGSSTKVSELETMVMEETSRLTEIFDMLEPKLAEVLRFQNNLTAITGLGQSASNPIRSCSALPAYYPSGNYYVRGADGSATQLNCTAVDSCYGGSGYWAKVADFNLRIPSHNCPAGLREHTRENIRLCVRSNNNPTCSMGILYNRAGTEFSRVCGKIIGYQIGHTNAFFRQQNVNSSRDNYVDGISLTHGTSYKHIWTFAAAIEDSVSPTLNPSKCACSIPTMASAFTMPPGFVGEDYFCDSASRSGSPTAGQFLGMDPLWDGTGCGSISTCCGMNTPPWFFKQLREPASEHIEMRVCSDEPASNEDIAIESVELYIQ